MTLFEAAGENRQLRYIDGDSGTVYPFAQLPLFTPRVSERKYLAFLYVDNSLPSICVFWSFVRSNYAVALLSPNMSEGFKAQLEDIYTPACIYDGTREAVEGYAPVFYSEQISVHYTDEPHNYAIHDAVKVLLNTSGTTGSPKFVKLSEANLMANARSITAYLPIKADDVAPLNLPVYYSYGLSVLTSNTIAGGSIVCTNIDVLNKAFWQNMKDYGYTSIAGVPFVYEMLERIGFRKSLYPTLRYMTVAGGRLEVPIMQKFAAYASEHDMEFYVMYGQTEATARMSYVPANKLADKLGSIGIAIKDGQFSIDNKTHELCYSGPNVFGGYVNEPCDLATYKHPSLLRTGDLARVDEDGYYYITGRVKRIVKLFGSRINLDEVESMLTAFAGKPVKCTGVNDKVLLVALTERDVDGKSLASFLSGEIKLHPSAINVIYIDEYPLSQNGKVDYNKLAKLHGAK